MCGGQNELDVLTCKRNFYTYIWRFQTRKENVAWISMFALHYYTEDDRKKKEDVKKKKEESRFFSRVRCSFPNKFWLVVFFSLKADFFFTQRE